MLRASVADLLQQPVTHGVSEGVVDSFELIQIEKEHGDEFGVAARQCYGLAQAIIQ